jgi:hypothetical protein
MTALTTAARMDNWKAVAKVASSAVGKDLIMVVLMAV